MSGEAPDLIFVLETLRASVLRRVAIAICEHTLKYLGLSDPILDAALTALREGRVGDGPERDAVEELSYSFDEIGWQLRERAEAGEDLWDAYSDSFAKARGCSALSMAMSEDAFKAAADAIYEARYAVDDFLIIRSIIMSMLWDELHRCGPWSRVLALTRINSSKIDPRRVLTKKK